MGSPPTQHQKPKPKPNLPPKNKKGGAGGSAPRKRGGGGIGPRKKSTLPGAVKTSIPRPSCVTRGLLLMFNVVQWTNTYSFYGFYNQIFCSELRVLGTFRITSVSLQTVLRLDWNPAWFPLCTILLDKAGLEHPVRLKRLRWLRVSSCFPHCGEAILSRSLDSPLSFLCL